MSAAPTAEAPDLATRARDAVAEAERRPDDLPRQLRAANALFGTGDTAGAIAFARRAAALDPASARAARVLSGFLAAAGDTAAALQAARDAVRLDPENGEARLHLGGLLTAQRRWREAAQHLAAHVASPRVTAQGWRLLSMVLHQLGEDARATEAARTAVAAAPERVEYRLHLASLLCARGHFDDAEPVFAAALAQAPDNASVWRAQSAALAAQGRLGEALVTAERAVALAADDPDCRAHLAHVAGLCQVRVAAEEERWLAPQRVRPSGPSRPRPSLWQDAATRWRVIHALILHGTRTRFGHTRLGYLWAVMEPVGHLATLGTVFFALNHSPPPIGENLFLFYITGLMPFLMFSHVSHDVMGVTDGGQALLQLPIVRRTDIMVAHALRQLATELIVASIIFSIAGILGYQALPADPARAAFGVLLVWLLGTGIGAINVVLVDFFPSWDVSYAAVVRLLYFSSGIYYSPMMMPDWVRDLLVWNPLLQCIDLFRSGFYSQYEPHWLDLPYLLSWVIGSVGLGFAAERALRFHATVRA